MQAVSLTRFFPRGGRRCPFCHDALPKFEATQDCPSCRAAHHPACWDEGDGCATCRTARREGDDLPLARDGGYDLLHVRRQRPRPAQHPSAGPDRMQVERDGDALTVRLASPCSCLEAAFISVWLCGWAVGEVFAVVMLFAPATPLPARAFLLLWLTLWTLGGLVAINGALDAIGGVSSLRVDREALSVQKVAFGVPLRRSFRVPLGRVRDVRAAGASVIIEHTAGAYAWEDPTESEAARTVALLRERLDLKA